MEPMVILAKVKKKNAVNKYIIYHVTTCIFTWQERCGTGDRRGTSRTLREDSCGSLWPFEAKNE
jgi:hypothetical protein